MKNLFKKFIPILPAIGLALIVLALFFTNYKPGTILTGWDNLHPEFNIGLALKRSIFAVWQEYQGPGLLGGMGHAADIPHILTVALSSLFMPMELIRYVWTFLMLFVGGLGAYFLLKSTILRNSENKIVPFLGGLFYILNLSTLQSFYVPYEAFSAHFAFLPWMILASINFIREQSKKTFLIFTLILLLASPAAYVPTLFVVYIVALLIFIATIYFTNKEKQRLVKSSLKLFGVIAIANAFWALPFAYFTLTNASTNVASKINQMASPTINGQRNEFANIHDVALLKGFWFQNVDPNLQGDKAFMLAPLRDFYSNPVIIVIGYLIFAIILFGLIKVFLDREKRLYPFVAIFIFVFAILASNTFPFSIIDWVFRKFPFFDQAFRFPFTKFSTLASLLYAMFLSLALERIFERIKFSGKTILSFVFLIAFSTLLIFYTLPAFKGNFLYEKETIKIPNEYFKTFEYFKKQDKTARIANLPQHTFWGWNFYSWGYGGSGFLWYGIEQPILDRAFDPWSSTSEQYYTEISNALYAKNSKELSNIIEKYQVSYLLVDKNVVYFPSPKSLFYNEIEQLLESLPNVKKDAEFGKIAIYKVDLKNKPNKFIYAATNLSSVSPSESQYSDSAFGKYSNYYSAENNLISYPFSQTMSPKVTNSKTTKITEKEDTIEFSTIIPAGSDSTTLNLPSFGESENIVPISLIRTIEGNNTTITLSFKTPYVSLSGKKIHQDNIEFPIFIIPDNNSYPLYININDTKSFTVEKEGQNRQEIVRSFLTLEQENSITLSNSDGDSQTYYLTSDVLKLLKTDPTQISIPNSDKDQILSVEVAKITDEYLSFERSSFKDAEVKNCSQYRVGQANATFNEGVQLKAQNSSNCIDFYIPNLIHNQGYAVFVNGKNTSGRSLHFWVLNEDAKFAPIDTYLLSKNETNSFILPAMEENGRGYSIHFDNESIGGEKSENSISKIGIYQIPYDYLKNVTLGNTNKQPSQIISINNIASNISHPNESLYYMNLKNEIKPDTILILSQSFNSGWTAYKVAKTDSFVRKFLNSYLPFIFGSKIKNHVMVNNWSNGWIIEEKIDSSKQSIVIVYMPQYFEYLGFVIIFIIFINLLLNLKKLNNFFESKSEDLKQKIYD